jgi:hypothetical protein
LRTVGERGDGGRQRWVLASESATAAVFDGADVDKRGDGVGGRRVGDLVRASRSRSGARPEAKGIEGVRRDARRRS